MAAAIKLDATPIVVYAITAAAGIGLAWLAWRKLGPLLNPASPENVIYDGATKAAQGLGWIDENDSIGTAIYNWLHPEENPAGYFLPDSSASRFYVPASPGYKPPRPSHVAPDGTKIYQGRGVEG